MYTQRRNKTGVLDQMREVAAPALRISPVAVYVRSRPRGINNSIGDVTLHKFYLKEKASPAEKDNMKQIPVSGSPPSNENVYAPQVDDSFVSLPLFAATAAVGGALCMLFLLRRREKRQAQASLPPAAAANTPTAAAPEKTSAARAAAQVLRSCGAAATEAAPPPPLLRPFLDKSRKKMRLEEKHAISHNTHRFRFSLEYPGQTLGLPIGKHLKLFAPAAAGPVDTSFPLTQAASPAQGSVEGCSTAGAASAGVEGKEFERKYTPVTGDELKGYVDLVVKVYRKGEDPRYPEGGKMSQYLHALQPGQYIDVQGPVGRIEYLGSGSFSVSRKLLPPKNRVGMLSGGTGITPMYQLIHAILNSSSDATSLTLLYANKTEADILLKPELDAFAQQHRDQFQVYYTVAAPSSLWPSFKGFIDKRMIEKTMPPPSVGTFILICGSPIMVATCRRDLLELGYAKEDIFDF